MKRLIFNLGNEARVYEYIVRHFLACLSKNAEGLETVVNIDISNEKVRAKFSTNSWQIVWAKWKLQK